jgi:Asp-tRNA(Asn)/Glu-tRNA(Gln) amidotransferase A subunit family amidase
LTLRPAVAQSQDVATLTLKEASEQLRRRAVSAVELTQACLKRIETHNPTLNAFITITGEQALATAREMDAEGQRGRWRGPQHGPIALKDNVDTARIRTTAASELFKDRVPSEDAEVVRRLKAADEMLGSRQITAMASISIIQSGCASDEISTSVEAGPFLPRNSSRIGARSTRYCMLVT